MQLERPAVEVSHILSKHHPLQVLLQRHQLKVILTLVEGQNRNPVVNLVRIRVGCVVHQNHLTQRSIQDSQILDVHILGGLIAVLAIQSMLY